MRSTRREFLGGALAVCAAERVAASGGHELKKPAGSDKTPPAGLIEGMPVLMSPAPESMGVVFAVTALAIGFAEVADNAAMKGATRFSVGKRGFLPCIDDRVLQVRMEGLSPSTRYWYRVGAQRKEYGVGLHSQMPKIVWGAVHSFVTPGKDAPSRFGMMSDTHGNFGQMARITAKYRALGIPLIVWNGDIPLGMFNKKEELVELCIVPPQNAGYAAEVPIAVTRGNHDFRGAMATRLDEVLIPRPLSERSQRYAALERNFAFRMGEIAIIGLDTGEDKPDEHPANTLSEFTAYRRLQADWLQDQFKRPEIKNAPYIVACTHIPLVATHAGANPGIEKEGWGYAEWHKECSDLWGPILTENRVQLVLSGHLHKYSYTAATSVRPWAQIVGGGIGNQTYQTLVDCNVEGNELVVWVYNTDANTKVGEHHFAPRH